MAVKRCCFCSRKDADVQFEKRSPYEPGARYPLGTNLAFYVGSRSFMVETESMGPSAVLKPGEAVTLEEEWSLSPDGPRLRR